ncbi:MAG TPA: hypothetical protein VG013_42985 [Gemmataceae bacterium]|jgi:hypothetical protein|nr:hypothetical protein [Gemmataceae bacterium]
MSRKKLSRDQKRKQKLARRAKGEGVQAYHGNKYKSERFVETIMQAEVGIYESYVMTDRVLTDREVEKSLEYLVLQLRGEQPAPPADNPKAKVEGEFEDMIAWRIKANWAQLFAEQPRHSNTDLAGVLRTILGSIKVWSRPAPDSRGYLHYIEGFLNQAGIQVEVENAGDDDGAGEDEEEGAGRSDEDILTELGEAWVASREPMAKKEFVAEAEALVKDGQAGLVLEVCHRLIGMANETGMVDELKEIIDKAWRQEPPRPGLKGWLSRIIPGARPET